MLVGSIALLVGLLTQTAPAVPGGCTAPAAAHAGKPGCYLSTEITISSPPSTLYWHIVPEPTERRARADADSRPWSAPVLAHGRWWLYVLSANQQEPELAPHHVAGPFNIKPGSPVVARFMESWFPPGMRTRVHSHSGPEAFYVIEGEQCTATPAEQRTIVAGQSYIVAGGAHLQAAPKGRRSVVLILASPGQPWMRLSDDWEGTNYCRG
jgi:quercetin dioxygenase-like cupin family protein